MTRRYVGTLVDAVSTIVLYGFVSCVLTMLLLLLFGCSLDPENPQDRFHAYTTAAQINAQTNLPPQGVQEVNAHLRAADSTYDAWYPLPGATEPTEP